MTCERPTEFPAAELRPTITTHYAPSNVSTPGNGVLQRGNGENATSFLDGLSAPLAATYGRKKNTATADQRLGFPDLVDLQVAAPLPEGVHATRAETAFNIRTRMAFGEFGLQESASAQGLATMTQAAGDLGLESGAYSQVAYVSG